MGNLFLFRSLISARRSSLNEENVCVFSDEIQVFRRPFWCLVLMSFRSCLLVTWLAGSAIENKKKITKFLKVLQLPCSGMYIIWTLFMKDTIKKGYPLKNVEKTTGQPPYCCLILNLRIDQENCIEEIQMTDEGGYIICSKARIWTQITFRWSKNYFKTTLKKTQRVIKTRQMT